jgi:beta-galactosidase
VCVITVHVRDSRGRFVPDAGQSISFSLQGPGRIIGTGNGNPSSHEPERFFETVKTVDIKDIRELAVDNLENRPETGLEWDDSAWKFAFRTQSKDWQVYTDSLIVVRGVFDLPEFTPDIEVSLFTKSITENQSIYVNGHRVAVNVQRGNPNQSYVLEHENIQPGRNVYAVTGKRFRKSHQWDEPNEDPGLVRLIVPAEPWRRKVFNGLAQVIVQSSCQPGEIHLIASAAGLKSTVIRIKSESAVAKPAVTVQ